MTVPSTTPVRISYVADGVTTSFPFAGPFIEAGDLTVELIDSFGNITSCALNGPGANGFTISGSQDPTSGEYLSGGTVVFNVAPTAGLTVLIARILPLQQTLALLPGGKFPAESVNTAFDRATMVDQQLNDALSRTLSYPLQGGDFNANGIGIENVGTPINPEDAATKSYVDNGSFAGAVAGNQFVNGIFIDTRGTGTSDDTSIWNTALSDAQTLGYNKIYARRPSNVKNLVITNGIEIIGVPGVFQFKLAASAGSSDVAVQIASDNVTLRGVTVVLPLANWRTPLSVPAGAYGILIESQSSPSGIHTNITLEDVTVLGGNQAGISLTGGDRMTLRNVETRYCYGHGIVLGGNRPIQKLRINGSRAIACGGYAIAGSQFSGSPTDPRGWADIEIYGAYAINCGKLAFYSSFDGGSKFGFDLTTNSASRFIFEGFATGCMAGGAEVKFTVSPPAEILPALMRDFDVSLDVVQDCDVGNAGLWLLYGGGTVPSASIKRVRVRPNIHYVGPASYTAGNWYEVGDAIVNAGNVYLCAGNASLVADFAGNLGAPTGTGTGGSCYFDGTLYWAFLNTNGGLPAPGFSALIVEAVGDANNTILVENLNAMECQFGVLLIPGNSTDNTIYNLVLSRPTIRNSKYGIYDDGNQFSTSTGTISNLIIDQPDIIVSTIGIILGFPGNGSTTGPSIVTASIIGGRVEATAASANALQFNGGTVTLLIDGGAIFISDLSTAFEIEAGTSHAVTIGDATFQNLGTGVPVISAVSPTSGTLNMLGSVKTLQPDAATPATQVFSGSTVNINGQVIRGLTGSNPNGSVAGSLGETLKLNQPTTGISRYDCTTAGNAAGAVWTAKA